MAMSPRLLRPRATGFSPKTIPGIKLWLDAADSTTISVATGVSTWADKSGSGLDFTQTTGNNQPAYTSTLNGRNVITFNGTSQSLSRSAVDNSAIADTSGAAAFIVFRPSSDSTFSVFQNSLSSGHRDQFSGQIYSATFRGSRFEAVGASGSMPTNAAMVYAHAVNTAANTHTIRINGTPVHSGAPNFTIWKQNASVTYIIGNGPNNDYLNGVVAEILQYGNSLNAASIASIERYLGRKWGITVV